MGFGFVDLHPIVSFLYFALMLGFSMFCMHPAAAGISLICALCCQLALQGVKKVASSLKYLLPMLLLAAVVNPLINRQGSTAWFYLPSGDAVTWEAVCYGLVSGVMLVSVIGWFSCCNTVLTSDKFVYLFGRVCPSLSLLLSMALGFVPKFLKQFKAIGEAQRALGGQSSKKLTHRLKAALKQTSILITWSLENAVDTADSMNSRGYGLPDRSRFGIYRFTRRDFGVLIWILLLGAGLMVGTVLGGLTVTYYPRLILPVPKWPGLLSLGCFLALGLLPSALMLLEEWKWNRSASTI